ncbi:MAG: LCP family protein [Patescibacteria group bacterium]
MIDFKQGMETEEDVSGEYKTKKSRKFITYIGIIVIVACIFAGKVIMSGPSGDSWFNISSIFSKMAHITTAEDKKLIGEENDRINILLIGMGGKNHDGGYLADTIMLLSLKPSTKQVSMISIPRDTTVPVEGGAWRKVNSINATAEKKESGSGGAAMTSALSEILGTPITYYVRADFQGFINIVDEMKGVEVNVENTLDDYSYPIMGREDDPDYYSRYEHLHVEAGPQKMDGSLALKFARSRHGIGKEGTDFARAKRQQLILQAVKDKLLSKSTLLKPTMIVKISNQLSEHIDTNLGVREMLLLWDDYKNVDRSNIINEVIDNQDNGLLIDSRGEDGAYLLVPKSGNFNQIKSFVQNIFGDSTTPNKVVDVKPIEGQVKLQIINGTWITGLASQVASKLDPYNFKEAKISNGTERNFITSAIYDLSYGKNDQAIKSLSELTGAKLAYDNPSWLETLKSGSSTPEIVLILGTDAQSWEIKPAK